MKIQWISSTDGKQVQIFALSQNHNRINHTKTEKSRFTTHKLTIKWAQLKNLKLNHDTNQWKMSKNQRNLLKKCKIYFKMLEKIESIQKLRITWWEKIRRFVETLENMYYSNNKYKDTDGNFFIRTPKWWQRYKKNLHEKNIL